MDNGNTIVYSPLEEGRDFFITDRWGEKLHFKILSFMVGTGLLSVAMEVIGEPDEREPREFELLSDFDADIEAAELRLKEKIKKRINIRYLTREYGGLSVRTGKLKGRFLGEYFEVDGLRLSHEEFIQTF